MGAYDRSRKWLIQHHGDSILRLAGIQDIVSWRCLPAEVVQPAQLPDGVLEVQLAGDESPSAFVLELATYPESRVHEQLLRGLILVLLERRELPEVLVVVLHPKGRFRVGDSYELRSKLGCTGLNARWRVVELWELPAEELFAAEEPGLVPWIPLTQFDGPPEPILRQCRELIEQKAEPDERVNLLAVTQVLTKLRFDAPELLASLGGRDIMIESPLIQELTDERAQRAVLTVLDTRFGFVPDEVADRVGSVSGDEELEALLKDAVKCPNLESFCQSIED